MPPGTIRDLTNRNTARIDGTIVVQRGQPMFVTALPASVLSKQKHVDTYDPKTKRGYQRELVQSRVRDATEYYREGGRMPNTLLLNIREDDFGGVRVEPSDRTKYSAAVDGRDGENNWIGAGYLELPEAVPLWVYDGQHRAASVEELVTSRAEFADFPIPVTITLGLKMAEEMSQFYYVNSHAKSVKTDLAWELLRQMTESDPELAERLRDEERDWVIRGISVVEALQGLGGPWSESIQQPNLRRLKADRLTIPQAQFVRSLRPVLEAKVLRTAGEDDIAKIVNAYWKGVARVLPEPFDPANSPKNWVLQKGPGAIALNRLLPEVIEVLRARGQRLGDADAYASALKQLPGLSGDVYDEDGAVRTVSGADFWLSGPNGVASQFTGDSGRRRLAVRIRALLPSAANAIAI